MTRATFPNTDRFQGLTLIGAGALCLCVSLLTYDDSQQQLRDLNMLLTCGWLLISAGILVTGILKVRRRVQSPAAPADESFGQGTLNSVNPFSGAQEGTAQSIADAVDDDWESLGGPMITERTVEPEDSEWREARYGSLPNETYRILNCVEWEASHYDIEIDGKRYTLGHAVSDASSTHRFHDEATAEQVQTEARALVAEHKGVEAAKAAQFRIVVAHGT